MPNVYSFSFPAVLVRTLLAVLLLALRLPAAAQAPAWQSAVAVATAAAAGNSSEVTATAVDAAGNVFLTGTFSNTVVMGSTTLTSVGSSDVFVAKFNPVSNQFVWAHRAGGTGGDFSSALAVDGANVYVVGSFLSSTASFGPVTLTNANTNAFIYDVFVAKLTDAGNTGSFVWAQQIGGTGEDYTYTGALAVSGSSIYVAGAFGSSTVVLGSTTLTNMGLQDAFVAKLTDAGNTGSFVWAQQAGGAGNDYAFTLALSGTSVYMAGEFGSPTIGLGTATLSNGGVSDLFVAKITDVGNTASFTWAQRAGGTGRDYAGMLAVSGSSVYVAGSFASPSVSFGPTTLTNAGPATGLPDVFVAKLADAGSVGNFIWAQQAGGAGSDYATALALSGTNVYVTGDFNSPTAGFGSTMLTNAGATDVFVAKLSDAGSTGNFRWAQQAGGTANDKGAALAVSGTSVYVGGSFRSLMANFGTTTLSNANASNSLGFLASLTDPTLTPTAPSRALPPAQLYPNPARHTATLRLPAGTAPAPLTLTDALGRTVRCYPAPASPETTLDLRGLPAGLYLLRGAGPAQRLQVE